VIGKNPDLVNSELDRYLKVTPADIQRAAKEYFVQQHATVLFMTPAAPTK
jgi:predicted Zn-dependent peptidase